MGAVRVTCVHGRIDYGYFPAATLEGFTIKRTDRGEWSLRGRATKWDAFNLTRAPLMLVVPHVAKPSNKPGEWRWPVRSVRIDNGDTVAVLGPPLEGTWQGIGL